MRASTAVYCDFWSMKAYTLVVWFLSVTVNGLGLLTCAVVLPTNWSSCCNADLTRVCTAYFIVPFVFASWTRGIVHTGSPSLTRSSLAFD